MKANRILSAAEYTTCINLLKNRFLKYSSRHKGIQWNAVQEKLDKNPEKVWSLYQMELSGGEPDVLDYDTDNNEFLFFDCAQESPKGRRSYCYDEDALNSRKEHKPKHSAISCAIDWGIELLTEEQYRFLQRFGTFDTKTSSWLKTPKEIRDLGGALFADFRYNTVFIYHNGASSYYAVRGFRGVLRV